jgi:hypothetical protein
MKRILSSLQRDAYIEKPAFHGGLFRVWVKKTQRLYPSSFGALAE